MNKTKFFHYVPKFYLRNFSIPEIDNVIWCFDKVTSKTFAADIRNIGCAKDFYDEDSEKYLSNFESQINPVCKKLVKTGDLGKLNWNERVTMATFVAIQDTRTQEARIALKEIGETLIGKIVETMPIRVEMTDKEIRKHLSKFIAAKVEVLAKGTQTRLLKEAINSLAEMLLGLEWILIENKTNMLLWTSDNPVNKYNPIKPPADLGNLGYLSPGIEIFLPLSPNLCLCLCDLGSHKLIPSEKMVMRSKQNVIYQNHIQLAQSSRHIFSQNSDFKLAVKILEDQPSLRDPQRKRVISS